MRASAQRGITFVTVLILLAAAAGAIWLASYGPAYWDNAEVKRILTEAANLAYHEKEDEALRRFVFRKLHDSFDEDVVEDGHQVRKLKLDVTPEDLQIERTQSPPQIDLWLSYSRRVKLVLVGQEKSVMFNDHASQDLSVVKW